MDINNLIGQGNTAEIYSLGEKKILKLFRKNFPYHIIEMEYKTSKKIQLKGLPVPKVEGIVEEEGRPGIIYERIYGDSMLKRILKKPLTISKEAKRLAELHYKMHTYTVDTIPKQKVMMERNINLTELLSHENKQKVLGILKKLPENDVLCHGDFHPGNVMLESERAVIIDWMTATRGSFAADVARTVLLLRDAALPGGMPFLFKIFSKILRSQILSVYLKKYLELSNASIDEIKQWEIPVTAARLIESIPESEKKQLIDLIERKLRDECFNI
jgi:uncharacterized protein (TIGR02172 family)